MPTLNDAYIELQAINGNLQTLHADNGSIIAGQAAIAAAIAASTAAIIDVRNSVDAGNGLLKAIAQLEQVTNATLFHISQQQDAMICALEAISRNTCAIHNEAHIQTGRQIVIAAVETAILDITRTVNPAAALDLDRREDQRRATEKCCPPPVDPPVCAYRPCPAPKPLEIEKPREPR